MCCKCKERILYLEMIDMGSPIHKTSMKLRLSHFIFLFICSYFTACQQAEDAFSRERDKQNTVEYAKSFRIFKEASYTLIEVLQPYPGANEGVRYVLVDRASDQIIPDSLSDAVVVKVPLEDIACLSTSHLPALEMLGLADKMVGFPNTGHISSSKFRALIKQNNITDLGSGSQFDRETLLDLSPGALMVFAMNNEERYFREIQNADIPVLYNADFLEQTPVGRAEWIKFTAAFFNKSAQADSIFNEIVANYQSYKSKASQAASQPHVFSGLMYGDTWYVPGGKSWAAVFLRDAGAQYLWRDNEQTGSLELGFESVLEKAEKAEYWINVADINSLEALQNADSRYTYFQAFKNKKVFTYSRRKGEKGGNDYLEMGYARPDLVLADLIHIVHPEILPEHQLYFYQKLQ